MTTKPSSNQLSTDADMDTAVAAAAFVMGECEGRRMIVLAEVFAILGAFYMAQARTQGSINPAESLAQFVWACADRAVTYDKKGLIARTH